MLRVQRRQEILNAVRSGSAQVADLAAAFGVSEMTVRRDLRDLESEGKLTRVYGGAVAADEPSFAEVVVERLDRKERIGAAAAELVQDGQTIMLDIGTTTLQLARHLRGRSVTVITSNLAAYEELLPEADIELVLLGGVVRRNYRSLVGVLAEDALRQLRADVAFLGASGLEGDCSVVDSTMVEVPIKRAMLAVRHAQRPAGRLRQVRHARGRARVRARGARRAGDRRRRPRGRVRGAAPRRRRGDHGMKLAIVGGGGFRVPLVYGALLRSGLFDQVVLHDVDESRLARISAVLDGLAAEHGEQLPFRAVTDLDDAVEGADFVFSAIRVGELQGRVVDETVPLSYGVLGQETTGPGGICFALRTIPIMVELAEVMAERAPRSWLINFTNPAGMVTEAAQQVLGERAVGICDSPSGLCRRVAAALGRDPAELWFDYFGLNHLGWLRGVRDSGEDLLPGLLADEEALATFEEGTLFGGDWLRTLGMVPNEYLYYFYYAADTVDAIRESPASRGAYLLEQQARFYELNGQPPADALAAWRQTRHERERTYMAEARGAAGVEGDHQQEADNGGYEGEAMAVVDAIANNTRSTLICNTANRSALPFLDADAVVEVPAIVGRAGPQPVAVGPVPDHAQALVQSIKAVERATIEAALTGSPALAVKALALHPLVPSVNTARAIFDGYRARLPELQERFG